MDYNPSPMWRPTAVISPYPPGPALARVLVQALSMVMAMALALALSILVRVQPAHAAESCEQSNDGIRTMDESTIALVNSRGELVEVDVFVADDRKERSYGYQYICESVIRDSAILFVYGSEVNARFHMNNVVAPLDIGFFDGQGNLLATRLMKVYEENEKTLYHPGRPFRYALEAAPGFFERHHLAAGRTTLSTASIYNH